MTDATLPQMLPTLKARWLGIMLTCLTVVALVAAMSAALPPRYEATAMVVVDMSGPDPIAGQAAFRAPGAISTYLATQGDIIRSEDVALRALRRLGLNEDAEWRARWQASTEGRTAFEPWLAAQLLRNLDVRPSRESNVLTLAYTAPHPERAAAVANAFVQSYVDATLEMRVRPARQFNSFFAERAGFLREALEHARVRLSAYEKEHGVMLGPDGDVENRRLAELNSQLVMLQDAATGAANARRHASAAPRDMQEVRNDPEVAALTAERVRLEGRLTDLKSEFGEQHHAVIQTRRAIDENRARLDAAMRRAAQSFEVPLKVNQARLAEARAAVERQRAVVLERKRQRDAAGALVRDVENAQKAYDSVLERGSQTALESANTTQNSVSILKSATPPLWSPAPLVRNLVVAVLLGLLLGVAWALYAEGRDRRLRTLADVTHRLRQPLLLMLPDATAGRDRRSQQTRQRLVSVGPPRLLGSARRGSRP